MVWGREPPNVWWPEYRSAECCSRGDTRLFFLYRTTVKNYRYSDLGVCGTRFLKIKQNEPVTSRKTDSIFVANYKLCALKWKLEFCKTYICRHKFDGFPILKAFSNEIERDVDKCEYLMLYNPKIDQHLQDLHNSIN